jgi:hypothetical protein
MEHSQKKFLSMFAAVVFLGIGILLLAARVLTRDQLFLCLLVAGAIITILQLWIGKR